MKVCFPVQSDQGIESRVHNHFGTAPVFIVFDTDTKNISAISNNDQHHAHGACNPIKALGDQMVDAIVVGGIGGGALSSLNQLGIRVYCSAAANIKDNITMFQSQQLSEYTQQQSCRGHADGHECAH